MFSFLRRLRGKKPLNLCIAIERDGDLHRLEIEGTDSAPVQLDRTTQALFAGETVYLMISANRKQMSAVVEIGTNEGTLRQTVTLPCYTVSFTATEGVTRIKVSSGETICIEQSLHVDRMPKSTHAKVI
jgi:hypothetical protein